MLHYVIVHIFAKYNPILNFFSLAHSMDSWQ